MTWFTVVNGVLFGLYLGLYSANWEIPALIGVIGWGIGLASGLIVHRLEAEKRMFAVEQLTVTQTPPERTDESLTDRSSSVSLLQEA